MIQYPRYRQHRFSSFQVIIAGFAAVDLVGALLLMLPIAAQQRCVTPFHEALFTSTSALCVTGLVVQDTGSYWSAFGQSVILLLIQIGGLGVITVGAAFAPCRGLPSADGASLHLAAARSNTTFLRDCIHRSVSRSCPLPIEELTSGSFLARLVCPDTPAEPAPAVPRWVLSCTGHTAHAAASHPVFAPSPVQ